MSPSRSTDETTLEPQSATRLARPPLTPLGRTIRAFVLLCCWCLLSVAHADPVEINGQWYQAAAATPDDWRAVDGLTLTAGRYRFEGTFNVPVTGDYVIDFKHTSTLGRFDHEVFTAAGVLVAKLTGGLQRPLYHPFPQRHGQPLELAAGHYRLITRIESPFLIAQPAPYIDERAHYSQAIRPGNALTLVCLGIFIGLGLYYLTLAAVRRNLAHALYAAFIIGNLLYNSTALLVVSDLFGVSSIYLSSVPILFSNAAYVWFVMCLLDIRRTTAPLLHTAGISALGILAGFAALAAWQPHWSMELARYGVALFLIYGMVAGGWQSVRGNRLARWYLVANTALFAAGWTAISNHALGDTYTFHVEHLGLLAVTLEVLLLAFVLSYQIGELQTERRHALERAEHNLRLAMTDALTGLPNRYALENSLAELPSGGSLTFIDLDGLKRYNDLYGHEQGDRLLCAFGRLLTELLAPHATVHRFGGDEFVVTTRTGQIAHVELMVTKAIETMRLEGYEVNGASCGSVYAHECATRNELKNLADARMYENKRRSTEAAIFERQDASEAASSLVG